MENPIEKFSDRINELNRLHKLAQESKSAWQIAARSDDSTDEQLDSLASTMHEYGNEYARQELSLRVDAEKFIGKGKPLGDFWETIYKMRKAN